MVGRGRRVHPLLVLVLVLLRVLQSEPQTKPKPEVQQCLRVCRTMGSATATAAAASLRVQRAGQSRRNRCYERLMVDRRTGLRMMWGGTTDRSRDNRCCALAGAGGRGRMASR